MSPKECKVTDPKAEAQRKIDEAKALQEELDKAVKESIEKQSRGEQPR